MLGDWVKVEHVTPDKPEVYTIADVLGMDPDTVFGKLVRIWIWADQQTYDGYAGTVTRALLDRVAGTPGFADAMEKSGWLQKTDNGLIFPNFSRHNGRTAKDRALSQKRMSLLRSKRNNGVTKNEQDRNKTVTWDGCEVEEKEENKKEEKGPPHTPPKEKKKQEKKKNPLQPPKMGFDKFWEAYPRKVSKQDAIKAWNKLAPDEALQALILVALSSQKTWPAWTKDGGQFIPHPATWLNGRRWEDQQNPKGLTGYGEGQNPYRFDPERVYPG